MFYTEIYRDGRASEASEICLIRGNENKMYDWCWIDFNKQIARRVLGAKNWLSLRLTVEERMSWTSYHYITVRHSQKRQLVKNCKIFILLVFFTHNNKNRGHPCTLCKPTSSRPAASPKSNCYRLSYFVPSHGNECSPDSNLEYSERQMFEVKTITLYLIYCGY